MVATDDGFAPIDMDHTYLVVTNNYVRIGGDGYKMFAGDDKNAYDYGPDLADVTAEYMAEHSPVSALCGWAHHQQMTHLPGCGGALPLCAMGAFTPGYFEQEEGGGFPSLSSFEQGFSSAGRHGRFAPWTIR